MIFVNILISILTIMALQFIGMYVFSVLTPFNDFEELKKGNVAVGLAMGGKFMGTAIVLGVSAFTNSSIIHMALWFGVGYICLIATYLLFDLVTPKMSVAEQLQNRNTAVGILLCFLYIGMGFAISSLII
ncbi:hypothetical protein AZ66_07590 [Paenibacillus sp. E194]|jgi:putative membrane protein|uniref:DUF350 domain-containing protein n=2 Tax=Paenibacillus alvei TaxID=44250 RepID=S9STZ6_PAEAL|nr:MULTISPECIES: DUF350 domain-containing protein [Paenibacillus]EPY09247.1 hypothetical protein PAALTS15_00100 [Paenibacillus alvei TS-15]EPY11075.1 hypothetical protein PAAL66ix_19774 [Paenibacillus alvei A6-6i-x]KJB88417.1 hypothetical protein AZ66_07590 [Paenibacillus sp. E194]MCY9531422.1 DUF350 domain-containing protein [Paenibacillus alvei]OBY78076.1 hypothetical protein BBG47_18420 [Paenibacillus sp. KS1]